MPIVRDEVCFGGARADSTSGVSGARDAAGGDEEARRGWSAAIRDFVLGIASEPRGLDCIAEIAEAGGASSAAQPSGGTAAALTEGCGLLRDAMPSTVEQVS